MLFIRTVFIYALLYLIAACSTPKTSEDHQKTSEKSSIQECIPSNFDKDNPSQKNIDITLVILYLKETIDYLEKGFIGDFNQKEFLRSVFSHYEKLSCQNVTNLSDLTDSDVLLHSINLSLKEVDKFSEIVVSSPNKITDRAAIGLRLKKNGKDVKIIKVLKNSAAEKTNISKGDVLLEVDGVSVDGSLDQALLKLRGEEGSRVKLTIKSHDTKKIQDYWLTRKKVASFSDYISSELIDSDVLYIPLDSISIQKRTVTDLESILKKYKDQVSVVIVDLRGNNGGSLKACVEVSDLFLNAGDIVKVQTKNNKNNMLFKAGSQIYLPDTPIVLLANKETASGAEIIFNSIQSRPKTISLGEKTAGSFYVQTIYPLMNDYYTYLKFSFGEMVFDISSGQALNDGFSPDIVFDDNEEQDKDLLLDEALKIAKIIRLTPSQFSKGAIISKYKEN